MTSLVKKCTYCRKDLPDSTGTGLPPSVHCDRCKKNEAKYGKPGICKYCNLPAAFQHEKCVYCAHSERRNGQPLPCANCAMKAYFDPTGKKKPGLCRLCINSAHSQKKTELAGVKVPAHDIPQSRPKDKSDKHKRKSHTDPSASAPKIPKASASDGDHVLQVQQLKDKIVELNEIIRKRGDQLIEKEKAIASLQAEMETVKRDCRQKLDQFKKDSDSHVLSIHEKYKQERITEKMKKESKDIKPST